MFIVAMRLRAIKLQRSGMFPGRRQMGVPVADQIMPLLRSLAELGERACYKHGAPNGALTDAATSRIIEAPGSKHAD